MQFFAELTSLSYPSFIPTLFIPKILEEHRKNCVRQGKYVEADVAKNRIDELKSHEANRRLEAMKDQHEREKLGIEEAHMLEFQQFNLIWDKKSKEYQQQCDE